MDGTLKILGAILLPLLLIAAAVFFVLQTYTGAYGRLALEKAEARHAAALRELEHLETTVERRRARNRGLHDESVDLDLLDERARIELGMIRPDEVILIEE